MPRRIASASLCETETNSVGSAKKGAQMDKSQFTDRTAIRALIYHSRRSPAYDALPNTTELIRTRS